MLGRFCCDFVLKGPSDRGVLMIVLGVVSMSEKLTRDYLFSLDLPV